MVEYSVDCIVKQNLIANCGRGIDIGWWVGGEFTENSIKSNYYGVDAEGFSSQYPGYPKWIFFHNNLVNNTSPYHHAYVSSGNGSWDNGLEGNYWDDYIGVDSNSDGIGDSPYDIENAPSKDSYPLMGMFSDFNANSEQHVQTICNSTISDFQFNGTAIRFNISGENSTAGFCRICIPKALMNDTFRVFVNGAEILSPPEPLPCSDSTHNYLYFNYTHSTEEVIIIPEFPSFLILPLFMIATLIAIIVYRRKLQKSERGHNKINEGIR
jgi:hypothetical protein